MNYINNVKVKLMDNGDWEYDRLGIGEVEGRVFMMDLENEEDEVEFVREGLSVEEVLRMGVEVGVFEEIDWGYDENDKVRLNLDCEVGCWDKFEELVK